MNLPLRLLPRRSLVILHQIRPLSLPKRKNAYENAHEFYQKPKPDASTYFEERKNPSWWRRQDFDDKMTWTVGVLCIASIYLVWNTTYIYRGPIHDPYQDELDAIEKVEAEERRLAEEDPLYKEWRKRRDS